MMQGDLGNILAENILNNGLGKYYSQEGVEELWVNQPGEVITKKRGEDWKAFEAPEITLDYLAQVCQVLSNINQSNFSENGLPVVSCELPGQPYRFQAIMGSNVRYQLSDRRGIALAIRALTADSSITFESYELRNGQALPGAQRAIGSIGDFEISQDHIDQIIESINKNLSIIVSGATSTGKTTFLNQLIRVLPERTRLITVEDAREVTVPHHNRVHLMVPRNKGVNLVDWNVIIDNLMRLTPDWVIAGEISVHNAMSVYSLMGKGHPVITTVHAATPDEAIHAFINNMSSSGSNLEAESTRRTLRSQIGCLIQLDRHDGVRKVVEITYPSLEEQLIKEEEKLRRKERVKALNG